MMKVSLASLLVASIVIVGCGSSQNEPAAPPIAESELRSMPLEARRDRFEANNDEEVGYHNPKTGWEAEYTLDVEYNLDGSVERINFPSGGWIDNFASESDNGDGTVTVETYDGKEFTVPKGESAFSEPSSDSDTDDDPESDSESGEGY